MSEKQIKPLSPKEIIDGLDKIIPEFIIQAVNNLLKKEYRGGHVTIKAKDIIKESLSLYSGDDKMTADKIYKEKWMDFETLFEKHGWDVTYDGPAYNETYDAFYKFAPKK